MEYFKCLTSILEMECECPNCESINFYRMDADRNEPCHDADGLMCWNCKQEFFWDKIAAENCENDIEYGMFDEGEKE